MRAMALMAVACVWERKWQWRLGVIRWCGGDEGDSGVDLQSLSAWGR
jgi:hypothetical protein